MSMNCVWGLNHNQQHHTSEKPSDSCSMNTWDMTNLASCTALKDK